MPRGPANHKAAARAAASPAASSAPSPSQSASSFSLPPPSPSASASALAAPFATRTAATSQSSTATTSTSLSCRVPAPVIARWRTLSPGSSSGLVDVVSNNQSTASLCVRRETLQPPQSHSRPPSRAPQTSFKLPRTRTLPSLAGPSSTFPPRRASTRTVTATGASTSTEATADLDVEVDSEVDDVDQSVATDLIEIRALRAKFSELDPDDTGVIDREDFGTLFASVVQLPDTLPTSARERLLGFASELFDANDGGTLHLRDFIAGCMVLGRGSEAERLRYLFQVFDRDRSGGLGLHELQRVFHVLQSYASARSVFSVTTDIAPPAFAPPNLTAEDAHNLAMRALREHDRDHDGQLSFDEFVTWCSSDRDAKALLDALSSDTARGMDRLRAEREREMLLAELANMGFEDIRGYKSGYSLVEAAATSHGDAIMSSSSYDLPPATPGARTPRQIIASPYLSPGPIELANAASDVLLFTPPSNRAPSSQHTSGVFSSGPLSKSRSSRGTDDEGSGVNDPNASFKSGSTHHDRQEESQYQVQRSESGRPGTFEIDYKSLKLINQIGEGSFAKVWRGKWLDIDVAVKILKSGPPMSNPLAPEGPLSSSIVGSGARLPPRGGPTGPPKQGGSFLDDTLEPEMASDYGAESRDAPHGLHGAVPAAFGAVNGGAPPGAGNQEEPEGNRQVGAAHPLPHVPEVGTGETATVGRMRDRHHFLREIGLLTSLRHPNVLLLMGACTDPRYPLCIVSELVEGGSLHSHLHGRNARRLSSTHCSRLALHIARGMLYLHASTPIVLHRDLKSANILVESIEDEDNSKATIIDFGLSRLDSTTDSRAGGGGLCGSLVTMAPEVMRSETYQPASDVYSFGVILGEMFSGKLPFENTSAFQLMYAVGVQGKRPDISEADGIPAPVMELIRQCWAQDPKARPSFKSVVQSLNDIHRLLTSEIGSSTSSTDHLAGGRR